jgi:hypothetical protein
MSNSFSGSLASEAQSRRSALSNRVPLIISASDSATDHQHAPSNAMASGGAVLNHDLFNQAVQKLDEAMSKLPTVAVVKL